MTMPYYNRRERCTCGILWQHRRGNTTWEIKQMWNIWANLEFPMTSACCFLFTPFLFGLPPALLWVTWIFRTPVWLISMGFKCNTLHGLWSSCSRYYAHVLATVHWCWHSKCRNLTSFPPFLFIITLRVSSTYHIQQCFMFCSSCWT